METPSLAWGDFDGDGELDFAYGDPQFSTGQGRVVLVYPALEKIVQLSRHDIFVSGIATNFDYFGDAVATGDFDKDGYDDLAVGLPGEDFTGATNGGAVEVFYGSASGISTSGEQVFSQTSPGIGNPAESSDYYGEVLTVGDFDCDLYDDLAVGVPQEDLNAGANAGAVNVLYGSSGGVTTVEDFFHQNSSYIAESVQASDYFGGALAAANVNGDVRILDWDCDDLLVGVPGEEPNGGATRAGGFHVLYGNPSGGLSSAGNIFVSQEQSVVDDDDEAYDEMGAWIQPFDLDGNAYDDVVVGVPGEDCSYPSDGGFHFFYGASSGLSMNSDELICGYDTPEVQDLLPAYEECIAEWGECSCSEELQQGLSVTPMSSGGAVAWACRVKALIAVDICAGVRLQPGPPTTGAHEADCMEASKEAADGCVGRIAL